MNKVDFTYNDDKFIVQCNNGDKMKDIISKFLSKIGKERKNVVFLYNGLIINEELAFNQCCNRLDRSRNYMNVLVVEGQSSVDKVINLIKSNYIICPYCQENAFLTIKNFKLSITGCKKGHETKDLELKELEKTQLVDQSKISCDYCHHTVKSETDKNIFFVCNHCKQNLCPKCKDKHDNNHFDYIKDYEENQFYCKDHFIEYEYYCNDCKKDICPSCQTAHENHNITTYDSIIQDFNKIRESELKDTKEKIYQLKTIVNEMIYQLNHLNKNLDTYFEVYDNIISSYDIKKRNNFILQNINNMKKYNNNFLGHITEIIKDNNLKSQFTNILDLQSKIEFKRFKSKNQILQTENKINEISNLSNNSNNSSKSINNNDNIENNTLDDDYKNFNVNQIKELQTFTTKNEVKKILILDDGRIVTNQCYYDENSESFHKLCIYSLKNGFVCDINIDYEEVTEWYKMDDGNIIIKYYGSNGEYIKLIKINANNIEEIGNFGKEVGRKFKKLSKVKFLIKAAINKERNDKNSFFNLISKVTYETGIYVYEKCRLTLYKNIDKILKDEHVIDICQLDDNEFVFYAKQKGAIYGENDYLIFYDIQTDKRIKKLKVGKGKNSGDMILINKNNLIILGVEEEIKLIDVKNKVKINKFKLEIYDFDNIIILNDNKFLNISSELEQYELENPNTIRLKGKKEMDKELISKYPGNKLIVYNEKKITIYG